MISEVANDAVSESGKSVTPSKKMIPVYKSQSQVTRCFITFCLPSNLLYIIHTYIFLCYFVLYCTKYKYILCVLTAHVIQSLERSVLLNKSNLLVPVL